MCRRDRTHLRGRPYAGATWVRMFEHDSEMPGLPDVEFIAPSRCEAHAEGWALIGEHDSIAGPCGSGQRSLGEQRAASQDFRRS